MAHPRMRWMAVGLVVAVALQQVHCGLRVPDRTDTNMDFTSYYEWTEADSSCGKLLKMLTGNKNGASVVNEVFEGVSCRRNVRWSWFGRANLCLYYGVEDDFRFVCLSAKDGETITVKYISSTPDLKVVSMLTESTTTSIREVQGAVRQELELKDRDLDEASVSWHGLGPAGAVASLRYLCGLRQVFLAFVANDGLRGYTQTADAKSIKAAAQNYMANGYRKMNAVLRGQPVGCGETSVCDLAHPVQEILVLQAGLNSAPHYTMEPGESIKWGNMISSSPALKTIQELVARRGRNLVLRYSTSAYERKTLEYHYQNKKDWVSSSFLSTSKKLDQLLLWKSLGPLFVDRFDTREMREEVFWNTVLWVIDSKTGVDTDDIGDATVAAEEEVIFPAMTKFVLKGFAYVKMDEGLESGFVQSPKFFQNIPSISYIAFLEEA